MLSAREHYRYADKTCTSADYWAVTAMDCQGTLGHFGPTVPQQHLDEFE